MTCWATVSERQHLADEENKARRDDAIELETRVIAGVMRAQVRAACAAADLTRPILMSSDVVGEAKVDIDWAFGEWWSEHYSEYLLNPVKPIWDAFLDFWIDEHAEAIAQARIK